MQGCDGVFVRERAEQPFDELRSENGPDQSRTGSYRPPHDFGQLLSGENRPYVPVFRHISNIWISAREPSFSKTDRQELVITVITHMVNMIVKASVQLRGPTFRKERVLQQSPWTSRRASAMSLSS